MEPSDSEQSKIHTNLNKSSRSAILNSQGTPSLSMLGSALFVHYRPGGIVPNNFLDGASELAGRLTYIHFYLVLSF
jgi:hypothetical protein